MTDLAFSGSYFEYVQVLPLMGIDGGMFTISAQPDIGYFGGNPAMAEHSATERNSNPRREVIESLLLLRITSSAPWE